MHKKGSNPPEFQQKGLQITYLRGYIINFGKGISGGWDWKLFKLWYLVVMPEKVETKNLIFGLKKAQVSQVLNKFVKKDEY